MLVKSLPNFSYRLGLGLLALALATTAWAQHGSEGKISVTVVDPTGSVIQGAQLELLDLGTGEVRKSETQSTGTRSFLNLPLGRYKLTVTMTGFKKKVFNDVVVQAAQTTDIPVTLDVGAVSEVVQVNTNEAPLVETTSNSIGTTIDLKSIENLPLQGRDLSALSTLSPGYTGNLNNGGGTWNGLPSIAQGNNIDGVISSTSRMKFGGSAQPGLQARVEDIAEMTVQTDQLDLNQGYGTSNMQVNFVTRRGSNAFHGRVYEDFRNTALNANSWLNDTLTAIDPSQPQKKNPLILNEFGGSIGGPILKDRLFFFGSFAMSKQPGSFSSSQWVFTPAAQQGNFTYTDNNGQTRTVNILQAAGAAGFPSTLNSQTASTLQNVNGVLKLGTMSSTSDPNVQQLTWQVPGPRTNYFPTVRVDYVPTQAQRVYLAYNETKTTNTGVHQPNLPGAAFSGTGASDKFVNYTAAFGWDWTLSPNLVNAFRGGFYYNFSSFGFDGKVPTGGQAQVFWNLPNLQAFPGSGFPSTSGMNGTNFQIPTGSYYPLLNASDTMTWQHKAHTLSFGFSWWHEQNHYYNGVLGFPTISLGNNTGTGPGLASGDPALAAFNNTTLPNAPPVAQQEAESLYAILTGRINNISGQFPYDPNSNQYVHHLGAYNLDELTKGLGLFAQDSYRLKPNLTLNYGLRWDFTWADRDLTNLYHSAPFPDIFGPSGVWNVFHPGSLQGNMDPKLVQNSQPYNNWFVSPQPSVGIAWNPHLMGGDKTVIRAGFSFRKFTEPQQYVWNQASDYGSFYYQGFFLNPNNTGQVGTFSPGSLALGSTFPPYGFQPASFQKIESQSDFTFQGGSVPGVNGIDPHLKQPYTESWNFGIQHQLTNSSALEIRYVGNRTLHQWMAVDTNEINIFENGFLNQFKAAQKNLAINNASGNPNFQGSFANHGLPGQQAMPIIDAAFKGAGEFQNPCSDGLAADYCDTSFVGELNTGQAGLFANTLAGINGTVPYLCNLVGQSFAPCANQGFTGAGAGYPINLFQANPFAQGAGFVTSALVASGYSNYNGLQLDFRQRAWHGMQFDANYTWSHTLGVSTPNNWQGQANEFTLRNPRLSYGPTLFDIRHAINISGSFDLPFGRGKEYLNQTGIVDKLVGGWNIGTIFTFQTGTPFLLQGGNNTFNANLNNDGFGDSGVVLHNVTPSQLQDAVGVYPIPGTTQVSFINPKYLASSSGGGANSQYITPNTTPGTIGQLVYLHGPHFINDDISITKAIPIHEQVRFTFQAEMLNAFNHPNFQPGAANGCIYFCFSSGFTPNVQQGQFAIGGISPNYPSASPNQGARVIELRANIEF